MELSGQDEGLFLDMFKILLDDFPSSCQEIINLHYMPLHYIKQIRKYVMNKDASLSWNITLQLKKLQV